MSVSQSKSKGTQLPQASTNSPKMLSKSSRKSTKPWRKLSSKQSLITSCSLTSHRASTEWWLTLIRASWSRFQSKKKRLWSRQSTRSSRNTTSRKQTREKCSSHRPSCRLSSWSLTRGSSSRSTKKKRYRSLKTKLQTSNPAIRRLASAQTKKWSLKNWSSKFLKLKQWSEELNPKTAILRRTFRTK